MEVAASVGAVSADASPAETAAGAKKQRLFELRQKMNEARKKNQSAAQAEARGVREGDRTQAKRKRQEWERREQQRKKASAAGGESSAEPEQEDDASMYETAAQAEARDKKQQKKKKGAASFGWEVFNQDSLYKAHERRIKRAGAPDKESYNALKGSYQDGKFFPKANDVQLQSETGAERVPAANIDHMVGELDATQHRRSQFSRRRAHNEDADVDYINERNHHFNKKIARAFDPYTVEIKQNLERGTALPDER